MYMTQTQIGSMPNLYQAFGNVPSRPATKCIVAFGLHQAHLMMCLWPLEWCDPKFSFFSFFLFLLIHFNTYKFLKNYIKYILINPKNLVQQDFI